MSHETVLSCGGSHFGERTSGMGLQKQSGAGGDQPGSEAGRAGPHRPRMLNRFASISGSWGPDCVVAWVKGQRWNLKLAGGGETCEKKSEK